MILLFVLQVKIALFCLRVSVKFGVTILSLWHVLGGMLVVYVAVNCLNKFSSAAYLFQIIDHYLKWLFLHWEGKNKGNVFQWCTELTLTVHPLFFYYYFWSCLQRILLPLLDHVPGNMLHDPLQLLSFLWYAFFYFAVLFECLLFFSTYMPMFSQFFSIPPFFKHLSTCYTDHMFILTVFLMFFSPEVSNGPFVAKRWWLF